MPRRIRWLSLLGVALVACLIYYGIAFAQKKQCDGQGQQITVPAAKTGEGCTEAAASDAAAALAGVKLKCHGPCPKDNDCVRTTDNMTCTQVANPAHGMAGHVHCPLKGGGENTMKFQCIVAQTGANPAMGLCRCKSTVPTT